MFTKKIVRDGEKSEDLKKNLELDFRLNLYKDPCFPFFQSMGHNILVQDFYFKNLTLIGILCLSWSNENSEIYYLKSNKNIQIKGIFESRWFENHKNLYKFMNKNDKKILNLKKLSKIYKENYYIKI